MMKLLVTGTLTTVTTADDTIGYLVERTNGGWTSIAAGGRWRGTGATYASKYRALQHLLATRSEKDELPDDRMSWEDERIMREQALRRANREAAKALELATESTTEKDPV
jgi:hypothetical protein